jgi:hypothetical protein
MSGRCPSDFGNYDGFNMMHDDFLIYANANDVILNSRYCLRQ